MQRWLASGRMAAPDPDLAADQYELAVNLKTARALGIDIPPSLMLQATRVVE